MRLLRLELQGFKSFPDKMAVDFVQDGVSIVVGPNGCGKSNLVDAIRWVLGEQSAKHLRGASMEDVIFNGSSSRAPVGLAQVTLYFANSTHDTLQKYSEFSEISVTRKLYRNGESSYLINKTPCRLSDIKELFMDTGIGGKGYSIIEQGRIDRIVTANALDRRSIIDEAAGIVKFKTKRVEAERKFQQTRANLERVKDILSELEIQEKVLEKQVKEAEEYLEAKGRFEHLTQCLAAASWQRLQQLGESLFQEREAQLQQQKDLLIAQQTLEAKQAQVEASTTVERRRLEDLRGVIANLNREAIKLEGKIESDRRELNNLNQWEDRGSQEQDLLLAKETDLHRQLENLEFDLDEMADQMRQGEAKLEALAEALHVRNQALERLLADIQILKNEELEIHSRRSGHGEELAQMRERRAEMQARQAQTADRVQENESQRKETAEAQKALGQRLEGVKAERQKAEDQYVTLKARIEEEEQGFGLLDATIVAASKELHQAESRLQSIDEFLAGHEDYAQGAKTLLDHFSKEPELAGKLGFVGSLTDLVKPGVAMPPQAQAFLDRHFDLLIFKQFRIFPDLDKLIETLQIEYLELCFLDLAPLAEGPASNLAQQIPWLGEPLPLAGHFLFTEEPLQNLDKALLRGDKGLVGAWGNLLTPEKVFCLGRRSQASKADLLLKRKAELEELTQKVEVKQKEIQLLEEREIQQKEALEELDNLLEQAAAKKNDLEVQFTSLQKETEALVQSRLQQDQRREELDKEFAEAQAGAERFAARIVELEQGLETKEDRSVKLSEELEALYRRKEEAETQKALALAEQQQHKVQIAAWGEKKEGILGLKKRILEEFAQAQERKKEIERQNQGTKEKRETLTKEVQTALAALPLLIEQLKGKEKEAQGISDQIEGSLEEVRSLHLAMAAQRKNAEALTHKMHEIDIKLAQAATEAKAIEDKLLEEQQIKPAEVLARLDLAGFDATKAEAEARSLKRKVENITGVNLAAKKDYDLLMERLVFLREQSQDLTQSMTSLEESITEIDQESKKRFQDTYRKVNQNFQKLFPTLFGGGSAMLELTDKEDLLNTGVEIIAQPPGKKLQNMTLLSGGEKAMTAIALIFAIFQIKPSPFCLLDEVDAPLDDANNGRFNEQVKLMTQNSQFIIITHNKKTMEIGDALFGVTMEEPGASKIVSVDFADAAQQGFLAQAVG